MNVNIPVAMKKVLGIITVHALKIIRYLTGSQCRGFSIRALSEKVICIRSMCAAELIC